MVFDLTSNVLFSYSLIFARLGSALLFLPGMGETYVSARIRLAIALLICLIMYPSVSEILPKLPENPLMVFIYLLKEITVGIFIGLFSRILISAMHTAGMKISYMNGLSAAMLFDTNQSSQGSIVGIFLSIVAITLFFVTKLHHLTFYGIYESFITIPTTKPLPFEGFAQIIPKLISEVFMVSFKIASPIVIIGLFLYLASGLIARLMPNMQVFFVLIPIQIWISFFVIMGSISVMMLVFMNFYEEKLFLLIN